MHACTTSLWAVVLMGLFAFSAGVPVQPFPAPVVVATDAAEEDAAQAEEDAAQDEAVAMSVAFHPAPVKLGETGDYKPPDFSQYTDVASKKRAFYDYLLPLVHKANEEVARERAWLEQLAESLVAGRLPGLAELAALAEIENRYGLGGEEEPVAVRIQQLLRRVDVVPASLVIAQAAKESGWGTSRFAREGNNFFGIWCFYEGCGLLPKHRAAGRSHEVAVFPSVGEGVRYYIRMINTHRAYSELRHLRAEARQRDEMHPGAALAVGLHRYSERGLAYVREIQSMIRHNELHRFTRPYSA